LPAAGRFIDPLTAAMRRLQDGSGDYAALCWLVLESLTAAVLIRGMSVAAAARGS